jgi:hypothetical protein
MMYWLENFGLLIGFFIFELCLTPVLFFKINKNILFYASWKQKFPLELMWIVIGIPFLFFAVFKDTFFLIKILCDYQDEED